MHGIPLVKFSSSLTSFTFFHLITMEKFFLRKINEDDIKLFSEFKKVAIPSCSIK